MVDLFATRKGNRKVLIYWGWFPLVLVLGGFPNIPSEEVGITAGGRKGNSTLPCLNSLHLEACRLSRSLSRPREFFAEAAETISQGLRGSSRTLYQRKWCIFLGWCERRDIHPLHCSPQLIVEYLEHLKEQGLHYDTVVLALCCGPPYTTVNPQSIILHVNPAFCPQTTSTVALCSIIELSQFPCRIDTDFDRELRKYCPVRGLTAYFDRTRGHRRSQQLFVSFTDGNRRGSHIAKQMMTKCIWVVPRR